MVTLVAPSGQKSSNVKSGQRARDSFHNGSFCEGGGGGQAKGVAAVLFIQRKKVR